MKESVHRRERWQAIVNVVHYAAENGEWAGDTVQYTDIINMFSKSFLWATSWFLVIIELGCHGAN